jgi:BirA family biotin operon repressor/biotin-[acetyl-CoA-carboxylase] ligase
VNTLTFSALRLLSHTAFRSGEDIAAQLGVSRASISNAMADLADLGVQVFKLRGQGYRLAEPIEWLDQSALSAALGSAQTAFNMEVADVVASTNTVLLHKAALGAPHASVLAAEYQTQGKGRRGRSWETTLGGALTFSLLWRFNHGIAQLGGLSLAVAVALIRAMRDIGLHEAAVKWPNDLIHRYRKVAGILIELQGEALGPAAAVIGVGVNLRLSEAARQRIDQAVTDMQSVLGAAPPRNELLAKLLLHMEAVLRQYEEQGFAALRDEWQRAHAYEGRTVALALPSGVRETGEVRGVAEDGALLVHTSGGLRRFAAGEISLRAPMA